MSDATPGPGHNSDKGISAQRLKSFMQRIERLLVDKENVATDVKGVFSEAKAAGFDPKIMRKVIGIRKMDKAERQETDALIEVYLNAVGN